VVDEHATHVVEEVALGGRERWQVNTVADGVDCRFTYAGIGGGPAWGTR
jgi:hypothetical protein